MATVYEHIASSDHIRIEAFTHGAFAKNDQAAIGGLVGNVDINTEANAAVALNVGKPRSVFRAALADITGAPAVGSPLYQTSSGLTTTSGTNIAVFVVVRADAQTADFVEV